MFRLMGAKLADVPKLLRIENLDAFEYAAVRWGQVPQIKKEDAQTLGLEAKKNDVTLSLHGSYFINLLGEKEIVEASKRQSAMPRPARIRCRRESKFEITSKINPRSFNAASAAGTSG